MAPTIRRATKEDAVHLAVVEMLTMPEFATFLLDGLYEGVSVGGTLTSIYKREGTDSWQWSWVAEDQKVVAAIGAYPVSLVKPSQDTGEAAERLAYFKPIKDAMPKDSALHISRLGVLPAYRRQGLARAMIETCIAVARERGEARVTLFVWEDNTSARALYDDLGFVEATRIVLPEHPRAMRHGPMLLMEKPLC